MAIGPVFNGMYWAHFLHIYQPPTQKEIWVRRITDESYRPVFRGLREIPEARLSLNINGVLCELLDKYGGKDVLRDLKALVKEGKIELTGSAKYHIFSPLVPEEELERQIRLNEEALNHYFGEGWKRGGFFAPEMAYAKHVAVVAKRMGYKWIIIDELGFPGRSPSPDTLYQIAGLDDFFVFFRERRLSFTILSAQIGTLSGITRNFGDRLAKDEYVVTAMDGETFGHHRPGLETLLFDMMKSKEIHTVQISDLFQHFSKRQTIEPLPSTWAVTKEQMKKDEPYARWKSSDNEIQQVQWALTNLAITVAHRTPDNAEIRSMLDRALHSDQYWWASARPWWSLEMMERGAYELRDIVLRSPKATTAEKVKAEEFYKNILYTGFEWQRSGKVDTIARQENEELRQRLEEKGKLFITKADYKQMIETLTEQMRLSASREEYHRAAMIKDRIRELKEEMEKAHA